VTEQPEASAHEQHRQLASQLFNRVWELLDQTERSQDEIDEMINAAHASRYHWSVVGQPVNLARGDWQISRVYSVLGRAEPALYHAYRSLEIVEAEGIVDFDLAFAYEALARAHAVGGDALESQRYLELARTAGEAIAEQDYRDGFFSELGTVPAVE
jgi:hypothetical protein